MKKYLFLLALFSLSFLSFGQEVLMQSGTVNTCTGTFYDTGGPAPGPPGRYQNNEDFTAGNAFTICPDSVDPDVRIFLNFTEFDVQPIFQNTGDVMLIYDGPNTLAPLIGTYTGTNAPGRVRASTANVSGCLTIEFRSDGFIARQGWSAEITCEVPVVFSDDCLSFSAGEDQILNCATPCTQLTATLSNLPNTSTSSYVLGQPTCPIQPLNGVDGIPIISDDDWSQVITIPFSFEFYGNQYTQLILSDNGQISFDLSRAGGFSQWDINPGETLPRNDNDGFLLNTIYGAFHDLYTPGQTGRPLQINYYVTGDFPFRAFVLNFDEVSQFSCNNLLTSQQIILYESSNVIDVNIIDKPVCSGWNDGLAVIGIQGNNLTEFLVPPGRNTSVWTAQDEQWRFVPAGPFDNNVTFVWTDQDGNVVGNDISINVCPPSGITTYTVTMEFTLPNGTRTQVSDDVVVERTGVSGIVLDLGPDISTCDNTEDFIINAPFNADVEYQWFKDGVPIAGATTETYTVIAPNSGTYKVEIVDPLDPTCVSSDELEITYDLQPIANPTPNQTQCQNGTGPYIFDLTLNEDDTLGGQVAANFNITYHNTPGDATTGANPIRTPNVYPTNGPTERIYVRIANLTDTCFETTFFDIIVGASPIITDPPPYAECDDIESGSATDGLATFDLTTVNGIITNGDTTLQVLYFETLADQVAGNFITPATAYQNTTPNNQTLFVSVFSSAGCEATTTLDLVVTPNPITITPDPLIVCDVDNDGIAIFDLLASIGQITNGDPTLTVTFYGTELNAINEVDELPDLYENDQPFNDIIFIRIVSSSSDCFAILPLTLIVRNSPIVSDPSPIRICDTDTDGFQTFDLTIREDEILLGNNTGLFDFYYYVLEQDAIDAGEVALTAPDYGGAIGFPTNYQNGANPQTIYVLVVGNDTYTGPNNGGTGCYSIVELQLFVDPLPVVAQAAPYELCDDEVNGSTRTDQISTFDLTSRNTEITGGNTNLTVIWFETLADETAGTPIADPAAYQNREIPPAPLTPQTVIARVTNRQGCKTITTLTLVVLPNPTPATPTPLEVCDDNNDGRAEFDLTLADAQILNNNGPEVEILYYATLDAAQQGGANNIVGPYTNITPFSDTVFARLTNNITGCFTIVPLGLIVNPIPDAPTPDLVDLTSCDLNGGGSAIFDLTENTDAVYGTQDENGFTISFHESLQAAQDDVDPILAPGAFPSTGQTIWVRLENNGTGCPRISSFDLIIGTFPIIQDPATMMLCDDVESGSNDDGFSVFDLTLNDGFITNGDTALQVLYFETQADQAAGNFIDPATQYTNTAPGNMTLFVTVTNSTGCDATTTLTLLVNPVPSPVAPDPLVVCDADNDGIAEFNLTDRDAQIINGEPGVTVTYHELLSDAEAGIFPLSDPYQTIFSGSQTVYARATYTVAPNTTGCYDIVELELTAVPTPVLPNTLPPIVLCDPDGDGFAQFDLTQQEPLIYGTQDPAGLVLTYHRSLADAQNDVNAIVNTTAFTNTGNPQDIFIRLEAAGTGCFKTGVFQIEATSGAPIFQPTPFTVCDDLGEPFDGITIFDLTAKDDEITGGVTGQGVSYFETQQNALDNIDRIDPDTAYENTQNLQTIFVRVQDANTSCISYTTLLLRVIPNPAPTAPDPIILCDEVTPNDGFEVFDLTSAEAQILNGATWTITYYESYDDAFDGVDAISDTDKVAYTNLSSPQIIYVRAENAATGCFEIVELQLIVNPLPDASAIISDYIICEIGTDDLALFDLTTKVPEILNGQDPSLFTVRFFESAAEAANNNNFILNTDRHQNNGNPQVIYVGILNNDTGCYVGGLQQFNIEVREGAVANPVAGPYIICDNLGANDGFGSFDLTDPALAGQILGAQTDTPYVLTYYETLENAMAGTDPIIGDYENIINPQVVYARVTNTDTDCFDITEVILKVEPLPIVELPETFRLCVDENGNLIPQDTGEDSPPVIDTGLDPALYTFVWAVDGVVMAGETGPSIIAVVGGEYTVTVTDIRTGCETTGTTTVIVSSPPIDFSADVTSDAFADSHIITVTAEGEGENDYIFQLDFGPFQDSNVFENVSPGTHTVTIKDRNGCGSVTIDVTTVDYPLFFTPNQDGYHDTWNVAGIGQLDPSANIYIFDRFGKLLKQLSPLGNGWDGTYNGEALPSSDYWFQIEYKERDEAKEIRGHFTLKR